MHWEQESMSSTEELSQDTNYDMTPSAASETHTSTTTKSTKEEPMPITKEQPAQSIKQVKNNIYVWKKKT